MSSRGGGRVFGGHGGGHGSKKNPLNNKRKRTAERQLKRQEKKQKNSKKKKVDKQQPVKKVKQVQAPKPVKVRGEGPRVKKIPVAPGLERELEEMRYLERMLGIKKKEGVGDDDRKASYLGTKDNPTVRIYI